MKSATFKFIIIVNSNHPALPSRFTRQDVIDNEFAGCIAPMLEAEGFSADLLSAEVEFVEDGEDA